MKIDKHDRYLDKLKRSIEDQYDSVHTHLPLYSQKKRLKGEIDLMGIRGKKVDIFEVKCSFRIAKAKRQLKKIKRIFSQSQRFDRIRTFFYCGNSSQIEII
ncbi:hypothetical protein K9M79_00475 [Candidatus Woesearchaeota archaeon]|nr:hypothetical protein [Candidatus Woesearchaeota archaeon]